MIKLIIFMILGKKLGPPRMIFNLIKSYLILYMLALPIINFGQTFEWVNPYPLSYNYNPDMLNYAVSVDTENNVFLAGMFMFHEIYGGATFGDFAIRKHNDSGDLLYTFYAYGAGNIVNMKHDHNNSLILIIDIKEDLLLDTSDTLFHSGGSVSSHMLKLDHNFDFVWSKMIADDISYTVPKGFTVDQDNNIYYSNNNFQNSELVILNPDGDEIGTIIQQNVGGLSSIDIDNNGNVYTAGSCASSGATFGGVVFEPPLNYNFYIAKYNSQMEVQWVKFVEDITCQFPEVVVEEEDHVYFSGELYFDTMFGTIPVNGPDWVFDYFVARLNADGDFVWLNEVPDMDSLAGDASIGKFNRCTVDDDNNITITGFIRGDVDWGNGMLTTSTNLGYDLLVVKYNEDGELIMSKTGGGEGFDKAISSAMGPDDNLYIAGYGMDTTVFDNHITYFDGYYPYLLKLDMGNTITATDEKEFSELFNIFPNPAVDEINIASRIVEGVDYISLLDINGVELKHVRSSGQNNFRLDISNYPSGVYFLTVRMKDQSYYREKIIKL